MRRKLLFVTLTVAMLLAACGEKKTAPTSPPAPKIADTENQQTVISFAVYDWEQPDYEDLIGAFEEANPDVRVRLASIDEILELDRLDGRWPDDAWQRLSAGADVINSNAPRGIAEQGLVRDLTPFIQADSNFQQDDFYPGTLESVQWEGGLWTLPMWISFDLIYYDKVAFDEAGVSYPEPGWSWDDFLVKAKALTVREGDQVTRWGFVQRGWPNSLIFIRGRAGPLIDETTNPPTPRFDQPQVIEAVGWYVDLYLKEKVIPYFQPPNGGEGPSVPPGQAMIENGEAAMWHGSLTNWSRREEQGDRGIVSYPVDAPDSKTTPIRVGGLSMSAGTVQPDAAWRWMNHLSRQAVTQGGLFVDFVPARRSVVESSGYWEKRDEELVAALRHAIDHSIVPRRRTGYDAAQEALEAALAGEKSAKDALAEAQARVESEIGIERTHQAKATPVPTFVVATPEESAPGDAELVTITFNLGMGAAGNREGYRDLAQQFHEAHPDIQVEIKMPDMFGKAISLRSIAESADCFQWIPGFPDPESRAAILSLEPFLDADSSFTSDDFYPSLLERYTRQGQLWGLPAEWFPYLIEYNQDLFDAAGVDYPTPDWTIDDFLELAVALTRGEGDDKQYGFVPQACEVGDLGVLMELRGAQLLNESADPPAFSLNDPANVEALRWYVGLSEEHGVKPVFGGDVLGGSRWMERESLISGGRAAMWIRWPWTSGVSDSSDELNIGIASLPTGLAGVNGSGLTNGYFISAQTTRPGSSGHQVRQACWQWITFLTEQPNLIQGLPARRSVAESDAYRQRVGAEWMSVYETSVASAGQPLDSDLMSEGAWLGGVALWLGRAYDQVMNDEASAEEALNAAQKIADDYRACVIVRNAYSDPKGWPACMKEADATLPDFMFDPGE